MSEVKIYTVVSDELSPPVIGESFCTGMVRHSDYAALEQKLTDTAAQLSNANSKCAALAAKINMINELMEVAEQVGKLAQKETEKLAHERNTLAAENASMKHAMAVTLEHVSVTDAGQAGVAAMIINDSLHHSETQATDAFLAEVRAQESKRVYESILDNPAVTDMASLVDWLEQYANDSVALAAQLRKGAAL